MTVDIFNDFATNAVAETDGVWVEYSGEVSFLIARAGNKKFGRNFMKLYTANRRILEVKGATAEAKAEEINLKTMSENILVGWKGPVMYKGELMGDYSPEKAAKMLAHKDFARWVAEQSEDMSKFKLVQDEEDAGK